MPKYINEIDMKFIDWTRTYYDTNSPFNMNKLLDDITEQTIGNSFEGEDLVVKKYILDTCASLKAKFERKEVNYETFIDLIRLGEFLFSSNHQHFSVAHALGAKRNQEYLKMANNRSPTRTKENSEATQERILKEYKKLSHMHERNKATKIATKLNLDQTTVRKYLRVLKSSQQTKYSGI